MLIASNIASATEITVPLNKRAEGVSLMNWIEGLYEQDGGQTFHERFSVINIEHDAYLGARKLDEAKFSEIGFILSEKEKKTLPERMDSRFFSLKLNQRTNIVFTENDGSKWKLTMIDLIDNVVVGNLISPVNNVVRKYNPELDNTPHNIVYAFVKMAGDITSFERKSDGFSLAFDYKESDFRSETIKLFFHIVKVEKTSAVSK